MMAYSLRWRRSPGESGGTMVGGGRRLMTAGSRRPSIQEDETMMKKWKQEVSIPVGNEGSEPPASPPVRPPLARAYPTLLLNQTSNAAREELRNKYRKELFGISENEEEIVTESEFQEIYRRKTPMTVSSSSEGSDSEDCGEDGRRRNERDKVRKSLGEDGLDGVREGRGGEREAATAKTVGKINRNVELDKIEKKIGINIKEGGKKDERDRGIDDKERFTMEMKKKIGDVGERRGTDWRTKRESLEKNEIREMESERTKEKKPPSRRWGLITDERKLIYSRENGEIGERRRLINQRENERMEERRGINQTVTGRMGEKRNEREIQRIAGRIGTSQREKGRIGERK